LTPDRSAALTREARRVLRANDCGGYTVPSHGLYPHQWNWDAGLTALGWITFDEARAWEEYRWLLKGQWKGSPQEGFIPHIVFHQRSERYFPGPDERGLALRSPPRPASASRRCTRRCCAGCGRRARDKSSPLMAAHLADLTNSCARSHQSRRKSRQ
jgi:hypothetical protein